MEEQSNTLGPASKPFKVSEPGQPDLVVEKQGSEANSSSLASTVVVISEDDEQKDIHTAPLASNDRQKDTQTNPPVSAKSPHADLLYRLGIPTSKAPKASKVSEKDSVPSKSPMTPRRFLNFIAGLFIAGIAGSFSNGLITVGMENAFPPQYAKDFHKAQALRNPEQAFSGMYNALAEGERIEPLSRRFTNLTVSLARQLDNNARYLQAKKEWAKAAIPSEVAPPEFRERKRSYLINEAESEHLAMASQLETHVDPGVLNEVEKAGAVFQASEVVFHGARAYDAFVTAGELAADAKDFLRARKNFAQAEMIANSHWQDGGPVRQRLLEARWRAELQEIIFLFSTTKYKPIQHGHYTPGNFTIENRRALDSNLEAQNWDKIDSMFAEAQRKQVQDIEGDTLVSDMYLALGDNSKSFQITKGHHNLLWQWGSSTTSPRPWVAMAYLYNAKADLTADYYHNNGLSNQARSDGFMHLRQAIDNLRQALARNPEVATDPSFIKAIQTNLAIGERLSNWSSPQADLVADLHDANIAMRGNEAQFLLDEISYDTLHEVQTPEIMAIRLKRIAAQASKIGGDAGDEFYARAVSRSGGAPTHQGVDVLRLAKGNSLLAKKFGISKGQSVLPRANLE
ncbi:MAG: hypothetical protein P4L53_25720 [Candidatus Obscuribacterales bacterium]|nr:hypothetical protein [Candidatus Obscuribacterales bacterium]